ncbi:putative serine/threonine-protein kinase iks1 [Stygiomarasmius scandens]|uniref:Serine/threonine-protein kinase iks1 n=1 Tax=Marasmiellus scandens TaxID=2682957 RepID=A0ABR1J7J4_9AGAR
MSLVPIDSEWRPIFHDDVNNQVVLYNPSSHALNIRPSTPRRQPCPYCKQPLPNDFVHSDDNNYDFDEEHDFSLRPRSRNYFKILAIANRTASESSNSVPSSRSASPRRISRSPSPDPPPSESISEPNAFPPDSMAEGYFNSFFKEEWKLGMGANGSVFLCQHVLDGNPLGRFAVKKIAVGQSHSYLLQTLREVRLLERLHHPNIITYHHAWLETCQFSSFGPKVPTLHVLMQWAEGGSLDDLIDARLGRDLRNPHINFTPENPEPVFGNHNSPPSSPSSPGAPTVAINGPDRPMDTFAGENGGNVTTDAEARKRAFRTMQRASPSERERLRTRLFGAVPASTSSFSLPPPSGSATTRRARTTWKPIHLLSPSEIRSLFGDIVEGLAFLHHKSILHLDLKPGNVLLTWDDYDSRPSGCGPVPRAMLSDFGTSRDMMTYGVGRTGNTGTLEYTAPETLPSPATGLLREVTSKADMWSLGMILHKLLFFRLPYRHAANGDASGDIPYPPYLDVDGQKFPDGIQSTNSIKNSHLSPQDASHLQPPLANRPKHPISEHTKMDPLQAEVLAYPGFRSTPGFRQAFAARRLHENYLFVLENLLSPDPLRREGSATFQKALHRGFLDPIDVSFGLDEEMRDANAKKMFVNGENESAWGFSLSPAFSSGRRRKSRVGRSEAPVHDVDSSSPVWTGAGGGTLVPLFRLHFADGLGPEDEAGTAGRRPRAKSQPPPLKSGTMFSPEARALGDGISNAGDSERRTPIPSETGSETGIEEVADESEDTIGVDSEDSENIVYHDAHDSHSWSLDSWSGVGIDVDYGGTSSGKGKVNGMGKEREGPSMGKLDSTFSELDAEPMPADAEESSSSESGQSRSWWVTRVGRGDLWSPGRQYGPLYRDAYGTSEWEQFWRFAIGDWDWEWYWHWRQRQSQGWRRTRMNRTEPGQPTNDVKLWIRSDLSDAWWRRWISQVPRPVWMRTFKSCILVLKVINISTICSHSHGILHLGYEHSSQPGKVATGIILTLAVIDTWFDGLWISIVFGVVHLCVIRLGCFVGSCC